MDNAVISERLLELIDGREVVAAVFTTFTFEPEFFELEIIPLLLNQEAAYSSDERVKRFMVRENLRESDLPIDVFYDLKMFRRNGDSSPDMEYECHGVNLKDKAFHGKINMVLVRDPETRNETLLFGAGSNNLSRAGWWDNIECQHWVEIESGTSPRKFINILQEEIEYLDYYRSFRSNIESSALNYVSDFLSMCRASNSADPIHYFGLSSPQNRYLFTDFLKRKKGPLAAYSNWNLEIISPFFADDVNNDEYQTFFDMGIENIKLFLPFDDEDNALCQDEYYQHIVKQEGIDWAQWEEKVSVSLGLNGDYFRRLHAKVYHFYNGKQSWVFVGSVNFTYKAFYENAEAGFLTRLSRCGPLLKEIPESKIIDKFEPPEEHVPGSDADYDNENHYPEIYLKFDWIDKKLVGRTARREVYDISIVGPEGDPVINNWTIQYKEYVYEKSTDKLQELLNNGSLVKIKGNNKKKSESFSEHFVLLQQTGWSHKPLNLPELSAAQILAIYSGMNPERRQLMLIDAKIRELVLSSQAGELTVHDEDRIIDQFFSEYAEIFNAFTKFRKRLEEALLNQKFNEVDYYLTGSGIDSLVSLVDRTKEVSTDNRGLNSVSRYLILLSALEIYRFDDFSNRPNVEIERSKLEEDISILKQDEQLVFEDNSLDNRVNFFTWFEDEFFRVYKISENRD